MTGKPLEFMQYLRELEGRDPKLFIETLRAELLQVIGQRGWQVVLDMFRKITSEALLKIAAGEQVEFHAGQISAVEAVRTHLREYVGSENVDLYDEGLTDGETQAFSSP